MTGYVLDLVPQARVNDLQLDIPEGLPSGHLDVLGHKVDINRLLREPALAQPGAVTDEGRDLSGRDFFGSTGAKAHLYGSKSSATSFRISP